MYRAQVSREAMGRQRKHDPHLPRGVYFRHGSYYRVHKNVWYRLGKELPDQIVIQARVPLGKVEIWDYAKKVLGRAKANAKGRRQIEFNLTADDLMHMLHSASWRCSVTGTEFTLEPIAGKKPFAPSIDRINSALGYVPGNCRVVCVAANYAMNVWGEDVLRRMIRSMAKKAQVLETIGE